MQYLDYYIVKVKPEKRADFEAIARKIVDANRKNQGSNWLAYETQYGEANTVYFVSSPQNMAAIDTADQAFRKALRASFGADTGRVMQDMDNCIVSSRGEIRRRRWDLSVNPPQDQAEMDKRIGQAQWIRTTTVRVRPGHASQFEALTHTLNAARAKMEPARAYNVSQSVAGQPGGVFFVSTLAPSLGAFDSNAPSLKETLGDEAYDKYQREMAECVIGTETMIARFRPELSNPMESIVTVSRDFWMPKMEEPVVAARAKKKK
jgi:quinol monooxygenase YgiN